MNPTQLSSICAQCRRRIYQRHHRLFQSLPIPQLPIPQFLWIVRTLHTTNSYRATAASTLPGKGTDGSTTRKVRHAVFKTLLSSLNFKGPPKPDTSIFTDRRSKNGMVTTALVPLQTSLDSGQIVVAWSLFRELITSGDLMKNDFFQQFLGSSHIRSKLFQEVIRCADKQLPPLRDLINTYRNLGLMRPIDYAYLLVKLMNNDDCSTLGTMLELACENSAPIQRSLKYISAISYNPFGGLESELLPQAFENEETCLWVVIYAAYNYLHFNNALPNTPFFKKLGVTIPNTPLPPESLIVQVLSGYGFDEQFYKRILKSSAIIQSSSLIANLVTLRKQIKTATEMQDAREIKTLYEEGRETIPHLLTGRHYDLFISAFMALKIPKLATTVWNEMVLAGIEPTQFSWNALLTGCTKAHDLKSLNLIWHKMEETGVKPDTYCWTTRIHALFLSDHVRDGLMCLQEMPNHGAEPNVNTINAAMDGLLRHRRLAEAQAVLKIASSKYSIQPDIVTFNTLLRGVMRQGAFDEANDLLLKMVEQKVRPDVVTCTIVLNGIYKHALSKTASSLDSVPPLEMCEELLTQMKESGIEANVNTYTVLIDGLLASDNISAAMDVFTIMQQRGIHANAATLTLFVKYHFKNGDLDSIEKCWDNVLSQKVMPDSILVDATIRGYARFRPPPNSPPSLSRFATSRMMHWINKANDMTTKRLQVLKEKEIVEEGKKDTVDTKSINIRLSYLTYKEILGRLIDEYEFEKAGVILGHIDRRLKEDGRLVLPFAMHHLKDVVKILAMRGVTIPSSFDVR